MRELFLRLYSRLRPCGHRLHDTKQHLEVWRDSGFIDMSSLTFVPGDSQALKICVAATLTDSPLVLRPTLSQSLAFSEGTLHLTDSNAILSHILSGMRTCVLCYRTGSPYAWRGSIVESKEQSPPGSSILRRHYTHPADAYHCTTRISLRTRSCRAWKTFLSLPVRKPSRVASSTFGSQILDRSTKKNHARAPAACLRILVSNKWKSIRTSVNNGM